MFDLERALSGQAIVMFEDGTEVKYVTKLNNCDLEHCYAGVYIVGKKERTTRFNDSGETFHGGKLQTRLKGFIAVYNDMTTEFSERPEYGTRDKPVFILDVAGERYLPEEEWERKPMQAPVQSDEGKALALNWTKEHIKTWVTHEECDQPLMKVPNNSWEWRLQGYDAICTAKSLIRTGWLMVNIENQFKVVLWNESTNETITEEEWENG